MNRLKEIHFLKGKTQTREELLALEKEQIELELELATQPDPTPAPVVIEQVISEEPETLEDALLY